MLQVASFANMKIVSWFNGYLISSGKELWERPCESTLRESVAYNRAISIASGCSVCRSTVVESMDKFRASYIAQVKKMVAAVKLVTS
ncbi:hypothetical protein EDD22DRAFT_865202 [Suillus occidentalis]|nr:hypothetical protein EDD22DRAFT_865202 [Suillus occidentalis]